MNVNCSKPESERKNVKCLKLDSESMNVKCSQPVKRLNVHKCDLFKRNDKSVRLNTGLENRKVFDAFLKFATLRASRMKHWEGPNRIVSTKVRNFEKTPIKSGPKRKLIIREEFVLVLMKLRLGVSNEYLADIFNVSAGTCPKVPFTWARFLARFLKSLVFWPEKQVIQQMMPSAFAKYPNLRCIIDCSETCIEQARDLKLQAVTWYPDRVCSCIQAFLSGMHLYLGSSETNCCWRAFV